MTRLGFLVHSLDASQLNYFLVKNANGMLRDQLQLDVIAFFEKQASNTLPANFALMPMYEAFGFSGVAIATSLSTARKLVTFPGPMLRIFYVWDLEWLRGGVPLRYAELATIYRHPLLKIVTRSADHTRAFMHAWNREPDAEIPDCNLTRLIEMAKP